MTLRAGAAAASHGPRAYEPPLRQIVTDEVHEAVGADEGELIELEIVGESYTQDALAAIAGPKQPDGKRERVGVTLRCQPDNAYDANAIRVEVFGQLTGHVSRAQRGAALACDAAFVRWRGRGRGDDRWWVARCQRHGLPSRRCPKVTTGSACGSLLTTCSVSGYDPTGSMMRLRAPSAGAARDRSR